MSAPASVRKRVNLLIDQDILEEIESFVASGERSDFVNRILRQALVRLGQQKAFASILQFQKNGSPLKKGSHDIISEIRYGRRY